MALFTSDKNSEKVQKTEAVLEDAAKAQEAEQAATGKVRAQSYWQVSWNIFKKNKLGKGRGYEAWLMSGKHFLNKDI